ncbi:CDP-diacylglycerol--glycerol-3-phosphate 3-phosphatidyltransferase [Stella humosa]|uniref:CDP-diacylglycerol--glycerol-3-phosphate 3-phosphatidyltransferase n=1 Tax=Stella humosa TaxID=94 RepID=A0A3N1LK65_9PROT|nr:CDP-alcohol phosphatidyltransferase family protein [Stella humosa]ROP91129.1 CDP-diacylglycerol--glycerol-3-phosphate 3-phosphatidyltransferase [Stella humosa]BBK34519.1 CDP-alcohol phosphatidyltransferase [Stella humosa]
MAITLYALKPRFQALLHPAVGRMAAAGVTANQVTLAAAAGSVLLGGLLALQGPARPALFLLLPAWLALRMALNAVDGMLAREFGQKSRLGAFLNELGDVVSDAALYLPFALVAPFAPAWVVIVVVLAVTGELAGVLGQTIGASRRYDGPLGKSDRALVFGALGLWVGLAPLPAMIAWAMPVLAVLAAVGIVNRVRRALAEAEGRA